MKRFALIGIILAGTTGIVSAQPLAVSATSAPAAGGMELLAVLGGECATSEEVDISPDMQPSATMPTRWANAMRIGAGHGSFGTE